MQRAKSTRGGCVLLAFEYVAPTSLDEAIRLKAETGTRTRAMAGGTDVIVQLRGGRFQIDRLVDLKKVPELNQVSYSDADGLSLGAAVPCYRIYEDPTIIQRYPCLVDSAGLIGSVQIQARASVGGNLCNSSPSGDSLPSLYVLGATCVIAGPSGRREVPVEEFCTGPAANVLQEGELLVSLRLPPPQPRSGAAFLRFIPRNEMDIAVANTASSITLDESGQRIVSARIAIGAVGPTPYLTTDAANLLVGKEPNEAAFEAAKAYAKPINDMRGTIDQRIHLVGVLTKRTLRAAVERARGA